MPLHPVRALLGALEQAKCHWKQDDVGGDSMWETGCGHAFEFTSDGPEENGALFCCYCGGRLVPMRTSEAEETS